MQVNSVGDNDKGANWKQAIVLMGNLGGKLPSASPISKRYCNLFSHDARPPTGTVLNTKKGVIPEAPVTNEISRNTVVSGHFRS